MVLDSKLGYIFKKMSTLIIKRTHIEHVCISIPMQKTLFKKGH